MTSKAGSGLLARTSTVLLFALPVVAIKYIQYKRSKEEKELIRRNAQDAAELAKIDDSKPIRPPFPDVIRKLLSYCRLAYLSTVDSKSSTSHLSLMRFTYIPHEEVIIMSTNVNTKKFQLLKQQQGVALLIHDFGNGEAASGSHLGYTITLNGTCHIESGPQAEAHRAAHLKHNPDYPQFILGDEVAILCVHVTSARICNIDDKVQKWNVTDAS